MTTDIPELTPNQAALTGLKFTAGELRAKAHDLIAVANLIELIILKVEGKSTMESPEEKLTAVEPPKAWRDEFDERQQKQISFSALYAKDFHHGANGHNDMMIIAKMAEVLDSMEVEIAKLKEKADET